MGCLRGFPKVWFVENFGLVINREQVSKNDSHSQYLESSLWLYRYYMYISNTSFIDF